MIEAHGAERAVISILIKNPDLLFTINDVLSEADFVNSGAGRIFAVLKSLILSDKDVKIDQNIIFAEAERMKLDDFMLATLDGELVDALANTHVNATNLPRYVADIKQAGVKRALVNVCGDLSDKIVEYTGPSIDLRNLVENEVLNALRHLDDGGDDIVNLSTDFEDVINAYAELNGVLGIDIGLPRWQEDIGGIRNGTITGIFASTKVGKSQFSMWAAYKTAIEQRLPILYLDTELQARQQQMRLCGIISQIAYNVIEKGTWKSNKEQLAKIQAAFQKVKNAPIFYKNIAGRSVNHVIPTIRKFVYKQMGGVHKGDTPRGLVVYDYIKLMDATDMAAKLQEYQLIGLLMSALHDCAAHMNIPILALGQLNKVGDIGIRRIVENVDSATILRPKTPDEIREDGLLRGSHVLETKWSRNGPGHGYNEWVNVHFDKSCGNFREDKRNSEVVTVVKKLKQQLVGSDTEKLADIRQEYGEEED
jgi:replicative DNA helicase